MKVAQIVTYRNKTSGIYRSYVWIESTFLDTVIRECLEIDETPEQEFELRGTKTTLPAKIRVGTFTNYRDDNRDAHDIFTEGEFRTGEWEVVERPKPRQQVDIPLPDPSELQAPKPSKTLLDSARQRFRKS